MANILAVGIATLDIVLEVDGYPNEDAEVRALGQEQRRGGNATNTLVVLRQLGHRCAWAGTLASDHSGERIRRELAGYEIELQSVRSVAAAKTPTSYILLNRNNGSRTIIHYRDLPEYDFEQFSQVDLAGLDWIHFEGRNPGETQRMLERVRGEAPHLPCSLEVEKPRPLIEALLPLADVLMLSRHLATGMGFATPERCLRWARTLAPEAKLFLGWGSDGAYGCSPGAACLHRPARVPGKVVDTLGAGDVFNAAVIDGLLSGLSVAETLELGTALAGRKCGQMGLLGLGRNAASSPLERNEETPHDKSTT